MNLQMKVIRTKLGLKQADAAEMCNMHIRRYGSYERQEVGLSLEDACTIADAFGCTLDELAGREWPRPSYSDPRQAEMNTAFESMNEDGKRLASEAVVMMGSSYKARVVKEGEDFQANAS